MRKIILFIIMTLSLWFFNQSFSNWYGNFSQTYSGNTTMCNTDGDTTWGLPPSFTRSPLAWSYTHDSRGIVGSVTWGYFRCERWDAQVPVAWASSSSSSIWRTSSSFTFSLSATDLWGSNVATSKYRWDNSSCFWAGGTAYNNWNPIGIVSQWIHTLYLCVTDGAGNTDTWSWKYMWDYTPPTGSISYFNWWVGVSNNNQAVTYTVDLDQESGIDSYTLQRRTSANNPLFAGGWSWWSNVSGQSWGSAGTYIYNYSWSNEVAYEYRVVITDRASNSSTITTTDISKFDLEYPLASDVTTNGLSGTREHLAWDKWLRYDVWINWGSPITSIQWKIENWTNSWVYQGVLDTNPAWDILEFIWNMRDVDTHRESDGSRLYTVKITSILDQAWNQTIVSWLESTSPNNMSENLPRYEYEIYSNTNHLHSHGLDITNVTQNLDSWLNIADWTVKNLDIELKDGYWNAIIPATWINRQINFDFDVNNSLKLDQYNYVVSNSSVFIIPPTGGAPDNTLLDINGTETFTNMPSDNGFYPYDFQVYTPTYMAWESDGREKVNGNMEIRSIDYSITQSTPGTISNWLYSGTLDNSTSINLLFKPLYTAKYVWDLSNKVLIDQIQEAKILVKKTTWSTVDPTSSSIQIWFGYVNGWDNDPHPTLDFIYDPAAVTPVTIPEWHVINQYSLWTISSLISDWYFKTKITHSWWTYDPSIEMYISSHINYELDGKNVKYNADVLWKESYFQWSNWINSSQIWLKVLWKIQSKNQENLTVGQSWTDYFMLWNNSKASLKETIRKQVTLETKNATWSTTWPIKYLLWSTWNNPTGVHLRNDTILYYEPTPGENIVIWDEAIPWIENISWVKTIIIKWWNAYIKSNLRYVNRWQDMLWIIVMEDDAWNWWNIYVDTAVTELSGIFYADKSMISYNETDGEIDWWIATTVLKNQLYIYGTLFSENTVWGWIIQKCPYYVPTALCTTDEAKKYDLNYLRRYFLYDEDWDGEEDEPYASWNAAPVFIYTDVSPDDGIDDGNFKYPVIIEYNGNIQRIPPPLFEN